MHSKKGARRGAPRISKLRSIRCKSLALRELKRLARLGATVLLAFDATGVSGEETALFQDAAKVRFEIGQRLGKAMTHRSCLARQTTAADGPNPPLLAH